LTNCERASPRSTLQTKTTKSQEVRTLFAAQVPWNRRGNTNSRGGLNVQENVGVNVRPRSGCRFPCWRPGNVCDLLSRKRFSGIGIVE
jgi:hypothetical protein